MRVYYKMRVTCIIYIWREISPDPSGLINADASVTTRRTYHVPRRYSTDRDGASFYRRPRPRYPRVDIKMSACRVNDQGRRTGEHAGSFMSVHTRVSVR